MILDERSNHLTYDGIHPLSLEALRLDTQEPWEPSDVAGDWHQGSCWQQEELICCYPGLIHVDFVYWGRVFLGFMLCAEDTLIVRVPSGFFDLTALRVELFFHQALKNRRRETKRNSFFQHHFHCPPKLQYPKKDVENHFQL